MTLSIRGRKKILGIPRCNDFSRHPDCRERPDPQCLLRKGSLQRGTFEQRNTWVAAVDASVDVVFQTTGRIYALGPVPEQAAWWRAARETQGG